MDGLLARRSAKYSTFAPDVLPAWVAEMDFALAPAVCWNAVARRKLRSISRGSPDFIQQA